MTSEKLRGHRHSPDTWNEPISHSRLVLLVALKFSNQHLCFTYDPGDQEKGSDEGDDQPVDRTYEQGSSEHHHQTPEVQRMPDKAIGAGGNDTLLPFALNPNHR